MTAAMLPNALIIIVAVTAGCLGARKVRYHKARDATGGGGGDGEGIYGFLGLLASSFEEEDGRGAARGLDILGAVYILGGSHI